MIRLCLLVITSLLYFGATPEKYITIMLPEKGVVFIDPSINIEDSIYYGNTSITKIKHVIGRRESLNQYHITNQSGCMGRYQFAKSTLKGLGFSKEEIKVFLIDTLLQENAMCILLRSNYDWLESNNLLRYTNKTVGGVVISIEGMLAALHLLGGEALKDYLKDNGSMKQYYKVYPSGRRVYIRKYDGNNTSIKEYLNLFKHDSKYRKHK